MVLLASWLFWLLGMWESAEFARDDGLERVGKRMGALGGGRGWEKNEKEDGSRAGSCAAMPGV